MNEAVFISDLHLNQNQPEITSRFYQFLEWVKNSTETLYILGDFFHVWIGDDMMSEFEYSIAKSLAELNEKGIKVFWIPGNRDFLVGKKFLALSRMQLLKDPSIISLKGLRVMISHGDAYCLHDYGHQFLRLLTRPDLNRRIILAIPKRFRVALIKFIRNFSQQKKYKPIRNSKKFNIVQSKLFKDMSKHNVMSVVYGHIHRPDIKTTEWRNKCMMEYILSDWDVNPSIFCYNIEKGMYLLNNFDR